MSIKVKVSVRKNHLTGENIASAQIVNLQQMDFAEFCDYLAQDSTVGAADVAAVMTQLEKKLPLILGLGQKVQISQEGMTVRPTVSGSLTQTALKAKLTAKKEAGEDVDTEREIKASDLTVSDLTAGVAIDFSRKFNAAFAQKATFKRDQNATVSTDDTTTGDTTDGTTTPSQGSQSSQTTGGGSSSTDSDSAE